MSKTKATASLKDIRYLLTDIDDTLTTNGKMLPEVMQALWNLKRAGIAVIPVTGACAGWCDQIIRLWPVTAVIGENGAFVMSLLGNAKLNLHYWLEDDTRKQNQRQLLTIAETVLEKFPQLQWAKDQQYRLCDVAIDYAQETENFPVSLLPEVVACFGEQGATAKASSIHINAWLGDYSKLDMSIRFLIENEGLTKEDLKTKVAFVGDAPNDESMFGFFPHSFGVSNIRPYLVDLVAQPSEILSQASGLGFVELSQRILNDLTKSQ